MNEKMSVSPVISRGELFYLMPNGYEYDPLNVNEDVKGKPVLVVSNNKINDSLYIEVVYLRDGKQRLDIPTNVYIPESAEVFPDSTIACGGVNTVNKKRLGNYVGRLSDSIMDKVDKAILHTFDLESYLGTVTESLDMKEYRALQDIIDKLKAENQVLSEKVFKHNLDKMNSKKDSPSEVSKEIEKLKEKLLEAKTETKIHKKEYNRLMKKLGVSSDDAI